MPLEDFLSLNPQHNRPVMAGADETTILLPYDKAELFAAKLALVDQPMVTWQAYKLKAGETLPQVASRFGLQLETLRSVNGIGINSKVPVGHALLVPSQAPTDASAATLQNVVFTTVPSGRTFYHRVRKGETLPAIAIRYGVTTQDIRGWNSASSSKLIPGQRLRVISDRAPAPAKKGSNGKSWRVTHTTSAPARPAVAHNRHVGTPH